MPNWNQNSLYLKHTDADMIERAAKGAEDGGLFAAFLPTPDDLMHSLAESYGGEDDAEANRVRSENIAKHGFSSWYHWRIHSWGTKWDVSDCAVDRFPQEAGMHSINLHFDTAWAPPITFYDHLTSLGFDVTAYYYEPGVAFCGKYENGDDDCYDITGNSAWVLENIPQDIEEHFDIAQGMLIWEEEDSEEVDDKPNDQ